ncbi:MAG: hypothetical protein JSW50_11275 [Candidatus Latescibacterota bacterium]|nr:MAG: hypothetical protein JSW50_11275 [Candidatus Latescibacterota bacterium]
MKRRVPLVLLLVLPLAVLWSFQTDIPTTIDAEDVSIQSGADAGLKVYIDPVTKLPVEEPVDPTLDFPSFEGDLNTSSEGLTLEKSPVSGEMVNLQGRFRHRYTAAVGPDGKPTGNCDIHEPANNTNSDSEEE